MPNDQGKALEIERADEPPWDRVRRVAGEGQSAVTAAILEAGQAELRRVRVEAIRHAFTGGIIGGGAAVVGVVLLVLVARVLFG